MDNDLQPDLDTRLMAIAVAMARRGLGTTAPNPSVGAVLTSPGGSEIIARGWTAPGGRPHAEPVALDKAGDRARGATLYVTLEPCSHHGLSPPCAETIITAGVARVVVGIEDPDPRVAGRGLAMLREAGVAVRRGVLREACRWVTLGHILRVTERRPFVQLKMALAADGTVASGAGGQPVWVTGPAARARGHLLRATADAILIGQGTLAADNPSLTCRLPGLSAQSPARVVVTGRTPLDALPSGLSAGAAPVWWVAPRGAIVPEAVRSAVADVITTTSVAGMPWLPAVMEDLVARGVTRLLVEGGPTMWRAFDRAGLVDEVVMFRARAAGQPAPAAALAQYVTRTPMEFVSATPVARDDMIVFRRRAD